MLRPPVTVPEKGRGNGSVQMTEHLTEYPTITAIRAGISPG